jgi:hypothetical protein
MAIMEREFSVRQVVTKEDNPEISLSIIDLKGMNRCMINPVSTTVYLCIRGSVIFVINRDGISSPINLKEGESVKIPPQCPYVDFSKNGVTLIAVSKRAFDPENIIELPMPPEINQLIRIKSLLT